MAKQPHTQYYKIYGPPGTGKTTKLLDIIEELLTKYKPYQIAFVTFTRKGAYEGRDRTAARFGLTKKELPFFSTIHSLCFKLLNLSASTVMNRSDYSELSKRSGYNFTGRFTYDRGSVDDKYLFAIELARNNKETFIDFIQDMNPDKLMDIADEYEKYKRDEGVINYTDMLEQYLDRGRILPVRAALIDEAQDLTPLQHAVIRKMFMACEEIYFAGDDDQALYDWAGADSKYFIEQVPGTEFVLDKSYRLPRLIKQLADKVLTNIAARKYKAFSPCDRTGEISVAGEWDYIDFSQSDDILVVSRNKKLLLPVIQSVRSQGLVYSVNGEVSIKQRYVRAIQRFYEYKNNPCTDTEHKLKLYEPLFLQLDLNYSAALQLDLPGDDQYYYKKIVEDRIDSPRLEPTVRFNTMHTAKGAEADVVVVDTEMSPRTYKHYLEDPDSEWRCFYVGVTRAKRKLILKSAKSDRYYPVIGELDVLD